MNDYKKPLFSIGVPTYNRIKMLRQCILSILNQTFSNFEIIISNDNPQRKVSSVFLKIRDPRIRLINQSRNLREIENLNFILKISQGRYFTWLGDDDLFLPNFLQRVNEVLVNLNYPQCLFTSYTEDEQNISKKIIKISKPKFFSGPQFLNQYLSHKIKTIPCYGFFNKESLLEIGGMRKLGEFDNLYADIMLGIESSLLDRIIYINEPLTYFRRHKGSLSLKSIHLESFLSAQKDLVQKSINIFKDKKLNSYFDSNLYFLLKWCIKDFTAVIRRKGTISAKLLIDYLFFLGKYLRYFTHLPQLLKTIKLIFKIFIFTFLFLIKKRLKK